MCSMFVGNVCCCYRQYFFDIYGALHKIRSFNIETLGNERKNIFAKSILENDKFLITIQSIKTVQSGSSFCNIKHSYNVYETLQWFTVIYFKVECNWRQILRYLDVRVSLEILCLMTNQIWRISLHRLGRPAHVVW